MKYNLNNNDSSCVKCFGNKNLRALIKERTNIFFQTLVTKDFNLWFPYILNDAVYQVEPDPISMTTVGKQNIEANFLAIGTPTLNFDILAVDIQSILVTECLSTTTLVSINHKVLSTGKTAFTQQITIIQFDEDGNFSHFLEFANSFGILALFDAFGPFSNIVCPSANCPCP